MEFGIGKANQLRISWKAADVHKDALVNNQIEDN